MIRTTVLAISFILIQANASGQCLIQEDFETVPLSCSGSVDWANDSSPPWGMDETSVSSTHYIGFHPQLVSISSNPSTQVGEYITIPLSSPTVPGTMYDLSFFYAIAQLNGLSGFSFWSSQNLGNNPGYLKVWLGNANCDTTFNVYNSPVLLDESSGWQFTNYMFTATATYTHLTIAPLGVAPGTLTPYLILDDLNLCEPTILSADVQSFQASQDEYSNIVEWETYSELNSDRFEVYSSSDGQTYRRIKTVNAQENANYINYYQIIDSAALGDITYYKLKYVDMDGEYQWHGPISVRRTGFVNVYPNPFTNQIHLNFDKGLAKELVICNHLGQIVLRKNIPAHASQIVLNDQSLQNLRSGTYSFILFSGGQKLYTKAIKL